MYCYRCGKELIDGANFCTECGAKIENKFPKNEIENKFPKNGYVNYISSPNLNQNQDSIRDTMKILGICLFMGDIISAFIVPAAVKRNRGTGLLSAWAFTYQWGSIFYMFIAGVIILAIILIIISGKK